MKKLFAIAALLLGLATQPSISLAEGGEQVIFKTATQALEQAIEVDSSAYVIDGKIFKTDPEAGCYYLDSAGTKYMLVGSDETIDQVLRLGQNVELVVVPDTETVTACRVGPVLRVVDVIKIEKPKRSSSEYKPKTRGDAAT